MSSMTNGDDKRMGRPRSQTIRNYNLNVRLTNDEQKRLKEAADRAGLTVAALVRLRALESLDKDKGAVMTP